MRRRTLLLVNPTKPEALAAAKDLRSLIQHHGELAAELPATTESLPSDLGRIDLIIVLGGDGTLIAQARRCVGLGAPLLGVNMGRLGFLAEFDQESLAAQASTIFAGGGLIERTAPLLSATVRHATGRVTDAGLALNEAVITSGPPYRMISLALSIDGVPGPTINGDGLIVSTSLGSTAYNLSAGGPILSPWVDAISLTAIAPHSLAVRPVVIPGNSRVEITALRANRDAHGNGTTLVLDGDNAIPLATTDKVVLTRAPRAVTFVENPASSYWARLIGKLNWSAPPKLER